MDEQTTGFVNKVLAISFSCVGDAIMTTPVLESLHLSYPLAQIDIAWDARPSHIFHNCPYNGGGARNIFIRDAETGLRKLMSAL